MPGGFGVWDVNDGSGVCGIHNTPDGFEFDPEVGEVYNITGIVTSTFDEWKVDLRMQSDVETGPDVSAPFVSSHSCFQVNGNYFLYIYFNEPINQTAINIDNFFITNADIIDVSNDSFDPTKITLTLDNVLSPNFGIIISEISDMIGNSQTNLTYTAECDFVFNVSELDFNNLNFQIINNETIVLSLKEKSNHIEIFNHTGQRIFNENIGSGSHIIDVGSTGIFFARINNKVKHFFVTD